MSEKPNRRLSLKAAQNCENAVSARCRCRCRGALHGARRVKPYMDAEIFFALLPIDDAHYRPLATDKKQQELLEIMAAIPF